MTLVRQPAPSSQHFNQLGHCASSPGHWGYCYVELAIHCRPSCIDMSVKILHHFITCKATLAVVSVVADAGNLGVFGRCQ